MRSFPGFSFSHYSRVFFMDYNETPTNPGDTQMFKTLAANVLERRLARAIDRAERKLQNEKMAYEQMIAESQARLAETTLVPGFTKIYA